MTQQAETKRQPVPRGLGRTGPVILSYGFRPFFLAAGVWGIAAMALWIATLAGAMEAGGSLGGVSWHAHEMLFGYTSAALAGFLLTAIPNWTGRLPVSGWPLLGLFAVWCLGRLALLFPDTIGPDWAVALDILFLPLLLAICAREVIAGKKWKDLKVLAGLLALSVANAAFDIAMLTTGDTALPSRLAVAAYVMLIAIIGGRILPSFTRNWLAKNGWKAFPAAYDTFDTVALLIGLAALAVWVVVPEGWPVAVLHLIAGAAHAWRLKRWQGWSARAEGLVLILHVAYAFVPLGFLGTAAAALGLMEPAAALHVFTVGAIGTMTLAVMSRATRGHTGLPLHASGWTVASYAAVVAAALVRPLNAVLPDLTLEIYSAAGVLWMLAFALYVLEYAPPLTRRRKDLPPGRGKD
ncbi:NnrS family protein [Devosia albogilva]|uniref:NnrS family protein n=1 Tax=Devosia albogilva TaxID=429726 RepID=A0ABW5QJ44_9HYPH